ncbi:MAG: hypothetical protein FJX56_14125, partial [Alphaproteobacteria bacterium]|nr:hypothetical protein [Alphaproteobacteria bacterium]
MAQRLVIVIAALLALAAPAAARQDDPRLERLFVELKAAPAEETRRVEQEIWRVWSQSGSATIDALFAAGIVAMQRRQLDEALTHFSEIVTLDPGFAEGWNKRATVYYLLGDLTHSIADVERTLALEPRHFGALSGATQIYLLQDKPAEALAAL